MMSDLIMSKKIVLYDSLIGSCGTGLSTVCIGIVSTTSTWISE